MTHIIDTEHKAKALATYIESVRRIANEMDNPSNRKLYDYDIDALILKHIDKIILGYMSGNSSIRGLAREIMEDI